MSCTEQFATVGDYVEIWRIDAFDFSDPDAVGEVELALELANSNVTMALIAADACACSLPVATQTYLKKMVLIEAAALFKASCGPTFTDELRETYITWVNDQLDDIKNLVIDPCGGPGSQAPAVASVEYSMPGINIPDILIGGILRNSDD